MEDPDVRRWYDNMRRGSPATADVYARRLWSFSLRTGKTPAQLAAMPEAEAYRLLLDFVSGEERRGATGSYISHSVTVARSWLTFNGRPMARRIKIRGAEATPTLAEERVPTQEELRRVFLAAPAQWRVAAALVAHAGVRLEVLGNYLGNDGLMLQDLPDLEVKEGSVRFARTPAMLIVRPELSKAGHRYFTFLTKEAAGYVRDYLEERLRAGETLGPDTDLIHPARASKRFVRTINIGDGIRAAIRLAGFPWRPYVLRAYADTQMLLAESKGKIAHDYRAFFMGHKGTIEARYTTNKGRLSAALLQDMREAYGRCEALLSTIPVEDGTADRVSTLIRAILKNAGYEEEQLEGMDLRAMSGQELGDLLGKAPAVPAAKAASPSAPRQQVIPEAELPRYLADGWVARMPVNGSKFVVERAG